jgi:hypothetical protein
LGIKDRQRRAALQHGAVRNLRVMPITISQENGREGRIPINARQTTQI